MKGPRRFFLYLCKEVCPPCVPPSTSHSPRDWLERSLHPANGVVLLADSTPHLISTQNATFHPFPPPTCPIDPGDWCATPLGPKICTFITNKIVMNKILVFSNHITNTGSNCPGLLFLFFLPFPQSSVPHSNIKLYPLWSFSTSYVLFLGSHCMTHNHPYLFMLVWL